MMQFWSRVLFPFFILSRKKLLVRNLPIINLIKTIELRT